MNVETYFAPAIELGELLHANSCALADEKTEISKKIMNCTYLVRLRRLQSHADKEVFRGNLPTNPIINAGKCSFFVNCAVPRSEKIDDNVPLSMPYHRHDFIELIVVLRGNYVQVVNGCEYRHTTGDVCMLNPNVTHRDFMPATDERILYIGLSKSFLHGELTEFFDKHPHLRDFMKYQTGVKRQQFILFHPQSTEELTDICMQISQEDLEKRAGHHLIIKGLLVRLFDLLIKNHEEEIISQSSQEIEKTLVAEMIDYMKCHIAELNREEMAEFFHFNPDYLNRILLKTTGLTFSQNLKELRLQVAAQQLLETKKSVNLIISQLGFSNKSYFNRIFMEKYGVLPGAYRVQ